MAIEHSIPEKSPNLLKPFCLLVLHMVDLLLVNASRQEHVNEYYRLGSLNMSARTGQGRRAASQDVEARNRFWLCIDSLSVSVTFSRTKNSKRQNIPKLFQF